MIDFDYTYENINGEDATAKSYFNLRQSELGENATLITRFEELEHVVDTPGQMSNENLEKLLNLIKDLIEVSYGVREGDAFVKSYAAWEHFRNTGKYDGFLFSLFEDPEKANDFMTGLMPKKLREVVKDGNLPAKTANPAVKEKREVPTQEELLQNWREKNGE